MDNITSLSATALVRMIRDKAISPLEVAQQYIDAFAQLANKSNTMTVPANAADIASFVTTAMTVLDKTKLSQAAAKGT